MAQTVLLAASRIAHYGMTGTLLRFVGQDLESANVPLYLLRAVRKTVPLGFAFGGAVFLARDPIARVFDAPELVSVLPGIAVALPAFTFTMVIGGFMKAIRKPATAVLLEGVLPR